MTILVQQILVVLFKLW